MKQINIPILTNFTCLRAYNPLAMPKRNLGTLRNLGNTLMHQTFAQNANIQVSSAHLTRLSLPAPIV
jgi:hypothetical protein